MKKHKSVVAILLAVMMIFTMMPMMAFAAEATGWGDHYGNVTTEEENGNWKATRVFSTTDGIITATATANRVKHIEGQSDGEADGLTPPTEPNSSAVATRYFYDFEGATLAYGANNTKLDGSTWTADAFGDKDGNKLLAEVGILLVEPSYTDRMADPTANPKPTAQKFSFKNSTTAWKVEFKATGYDPTKTTVDQPVEVTAKVSPLKEITGKADAPELLGVREFKATITVAGKALTPDTAKFYFDTVGGTEVKDKVMYDGAAHTVVADEVPGYTLSYTVYNPTSGKFEPATSVSITDVQKDDMDVRAIFTKGNAKVEKSLKVNLKPCNGAQVTFDQEASLTDTGFTYRVPGTDYNAADYIVAIPANDKTTTGSSLDDKTKAANKADNEATAKAVKANDAALKGYFNDYKEVSAKTTKANPDVVVLTIADKELTAAQKEELTKKYAQLELNFGKPVIKGDTAYVYLNNGIIDYEVEFTKAPAGAVVYSKSKTTKKGVLKKNKSFSVEAVANNGATVYYKLINANSKITINKKTGKITVKKGLKKGTYKFQVKAYVPGSHRDFEAGYEEWQSIVVKVKK